MQPQKNLIRASLLVGIFSLEAAVRASSGRQVYVDEDLDWHDDDGWPKSGDGSRSKILGSESGEAMGFIFLTFLIVCIGFAFGWWIADFDDEEAAAASGQGPEASTSSVTTKSGSRDRKKKPKKGGSKMHSKPKSGSNSTSSSSRPFSRGNSGFTSVKGRHY